MRLLRIKDGPLSDGADIEFELVTISKNTPPYAILSHTWDLSPDNEFLFEDLKNGTGRTKPGYRKVQRFLEATWKHEPRFEYGWVDTCCIDKSSSAELSEAINSMFRWYEEAELCFVHLVDLKAEPSELLLQGGSPARYLRECRWFRRGWTLQELIAPRHLVFYSADWRFINDRKTLRRIISDITKIHADALDGDASKIQDFSIAQRMSWASSRETTRPEDIAYCLMGIFDVNMPLLYGEGRKAFIRLQEEIIKDSNDQTIFCWERLVDENDPVVLSSVLAESPRDFSRTSHCIPIRTGKVHTYQLTNAGLRINGRIQERGETCRLLLRCREDFEDSRHRFLKLVIKRVNPGSAQFARVVGQLRVGFADYDSVEQEIYLCKDKIPSLPPQYVGYNVSIRLVSPSNGTAQVNRAHPTCRWVGEKEIFSATDLDSASESLTGFSWHVAVSFTLHLEHRSIIYHKDRFLAIVGYDGWSKAVWGTLAEYPADGAEPNLDDIWHDYGLNSRRKSARSRLVLPNLPGRALWCEMKRVDKSDDDDDDVFDGATKWQMVLQVRSDTEEMGLVSLSDIEIPRDAEGTAPSSNDETAGTADAAARAQAHREMSETLGTPKK